MTSFFFFSFFIFQQPCLLTLKFEFHIIFTSLNILLFYVFPSQSYLPGCTILYIYNICNIVHQLLLLSHFSCVRLCVTPQTAAHQSPRPWDSPGKNTGVGYHFLLQCTKVKSEREVTQSCPTLSDPMDCSLPGSFVHGIFQARVLEWGAIAISVHQLYINKK